MNIKDWKKEIFSIPNLLSLFRLLLIPVYITIYLNARNREDYILAAAILSVSCLTDLIDGKIARRFNMITNVGKILDPIADKLTQFALIICLSLRHPILWYMVGLFFVKELIQTIGCAIALHKGMSMNGSLLPGKLSTTVLFISLIVMVMIPSIPENIITIIAAVNSVFLMFAFVAYTVVFFSKTAKHKVFIDKDTH